MISLLLNVFFVFASCLGLRRKDKREGHAFLTEAALQVTRPPSVWTTPVDSEKKRRGKKRNKKCLNRSPRHNGGDIKHERRISSETSRCAITSPRMSLISTHPNERTEKRTESFRPWICGVDDIIDISVRLGFSVSPFIVGERFQMGNVFSEGKHAVVVQATDLLENCTVFIKVQVGSSPLVQNETEVYRITEMYRVQEWFPQLRFFGCISDRGVLITEGLGANVHELWRNKSKQFSNLEVAIIGSNIILGLQALHSCGIVHCHLKPQHIVCNTSEHSRFHLIDFSQAKWFLHPETKEHFVEEQHSELLGCPLFASRAAHHLLQPCRRDDLESLGYVLLFLLKGELPWQSLKCHEDEKWWMYGAMKCSVDIKSLCGGAPYHMFRYFEHIFQLRFSDMPDYNFLYETLSYTSLF